MDAVLGRVRAQRRFGGGIGRTWWAGAVLLVAAGIVLSLSCGPFIRWAASARAARRHVLLRVGSAALFWGGVRLQDVDVRAVALPDVGVHVQSVVVRLTWTLRTRSVEMAGVTVRALGSETLLRREIESWREDTPAGTPRGEGELPQVFLTEVAVRWDEDDKSPEPRLNVARLDAAVSAAGVTMEVAEAQIRSGPFRFVLARAHVEVDHAAHIRAARAGSLTVEWLVDRRSGPSDGLGRPTSEGGLASLLQLEVLRTKLQRGANWAAERLALESELRVDALTWTVARPDDAVALNLGPGPAWATRSERELSAQFAAEAAFSATPLTAKISVALGGADSTLVVDGGPVSLSALGVRDGALGLVDVASASLSGRLNVVVAGDGASLTFDAEGSARGLALRNERLAPDVVRSPDAAFRMRGLLTSEAQLRLDDFGVRMGALDVSASGMLNTRSGHVEGNFHFQAATANCQALVDSVPSALLPDLKGADFSGTYGVSGRMSFDSRTLDDLVLEYEAVDRCRVIAVPPWLSREQFDTAFVHRIVLPDGSLGEMMTGPGTSNWTALDQISPYMQVAVLTTEDGGFYRHHGFNRASIRSSLIANIKAGKFVRGASTITMQLAKNLFLSRNKTLSRKLEEVVLTEYLEQTFAKEELMELYLNVIEFGPAIYGITAAAEHYFGRPPEELNLSESFFLASLLPSPRRLAAVRDKGSLPDSWQRSLRFLMQAAQKAGRISAEELAAGEGETILFWTGGERPPPRHVVLARPRLDGDADGEDMTDTSTPILRVAPGPNAP